MSIAISYYLKGKIVRVTVGSAEQIKTSFGTFFFKNLIPRIFYKLFSVVKMLIFVCNAIYPRLWLISFGDRWKTACY